MRKFKEVEVMKWNEIWKSDGFEEEEMYRIRIERDLMGEKEVLKVTDVDDDCIIGRMDVGKGVREMRKLGLFVCKADLLLMFGEIRLREIR